MLHLCVGETVSFCSVNSVYRDPPKLDLLRRTIGLFAVGDVGGAEFERIIQLLEDNLCRELTIY